MPPIDARHGSDQFRFRVSRTSVVVPEAPLLGTLLAVGLITGIVQSATQINDPAVGFLPRLAAAAVVCYALGGWMVHQFAALFAHALTFGH